MTRLLVLMVMTVLAAGAEARARGVLGSVGGLPSDVDVVVAMDDVRGFVRSPVGATVLELVRRGGGFSQTSDAWDGLASELGWSSDEAADALLGGRTVFAARWVERRAAGDAPETGGMVWAVLTELSPDAAAGVRRALKPVPRAVVGGRPVLSVEGGAMEMVVDSGGGTARLVLGPAGDRSLLLAMVGVLDGEGPRDAFGRTRLFREVERVGRDADTMVFFRSRGTGDLWCALVGQRSELSIETNFLIGVPGLAEHGAQIEPWNRRTFEQLSNDAYVVVLDMSEFSWEEGQRGGGVAALAGLGLPPGLAPEISALVSDRFALVVRPGETGPIEVAVGLETVDTAEMARAGDRLLCRYLRGLAPDDRECGRLEGFEQMPPTAVRSVDMSRLVGSLEPFGWEAGPHVTWRSRVEHEQCNAGQHHGWWTVGVGPAAVESLGRNLVCEEGKAGLSLPWLSLGMLKPAALIERLESSGVPLPPLMDPLRGIREVRWQASEAGRGIVQGSGRIAVSEDAGDGDGSRAPVRGLPPVEPVR